MDTFAHVTKSRLVPGDPESPQKLAFQPITADDVRQQADVICRQMQTDCQGSIDALWAHARDPEHFFEQEGVSDCTMTLAEHVRGCQAVVAEEAARCLKRLGQIPERALERRHRSCMRVLVAAKKRWVEILGHEHDMDPRVLQGTRNVTEFMETFAICLNPHTPRETRVAIRKRFASGGR